ncbi:MAG: helix-turn-helix domain-containing protein [Ignavibacteriae bacterium]|jgi:transcriptional regulator with XRE-family HTH domain|nr:helix-turn-helix domain-containing protein [Ignavibacteriota bacterium]
MVAKSNKEYLKTYDREKNKGLNEISKNIMKIIKSRGITTYQIEKDTGVYASTLENAFQLKGSWKNAIVLMKVADYLKVDINELLPGSRVQHPESLRERIKELEKKNEELRKTIEDKDEAIKIIKRALR